MAKATRVSEDTVAETKAVVTEASAEVLAQLNAMFPQGDSYNRTKFPKLVFKSQTVLDEDENVVIKAGTFFVERETEEVDEHGKNKWESVEVGKTLDAHIVYYRKRLQFWDAKEVVFYSTPLYDEEFEVIPLFKAGEYVCEGTPAQLKAMYPKVVEVEDRKTGEMKQKTVSQLRDARVIYVIFNGELLELTISGTSMYSFLEYLKKFAPQACITTLNSTKEEVGSTKWNKMSFKVLRNPTQEEAVLAVDTINELREAIEHEKQYYAQKRANASASQALAPVAEALALEAGEDVPSGTSDVKKADDDF